MALEMHPDAGRGTEKEETGGEHRGILKNEATQNRANPNRVIGSDSPVKSSHSGSVTA